MSTLLLLHQALHAPAFSIPAPTPTAPDSGLSATASTLLGYVMWGALIVCALAAVASGAFIAAGHITARPHVQQRGATALVAALVGVVVVGAAIPLVNQFISIA